MAQSSSSLVNLLKFYSRVAGALVILVPCVVLIGWATGNETLKRIQPGLVAMNPMTAVSFILGGAALWLLQAEESTSRRILAQLFGGVIALIGLLALGAILLQQRGVDQLLFSNKLGIGSATPNRMSPTTAFDFILMGIALLLVHIELRGGARPYQYLAAMCAWIALLAFIGYLYDAAALYRVKTYIPMALHTALTFLLLSTGLLCVRPDRGPMARITSDGAGGVMVRRMMIAVIGIPLLLGWLTLSGQGARIYDPGIGFAVFVVLIMIVFSLMVWANAGSLDRNEGERNRAEEALRKAHDELEARVQKRTEDLSRVLLQIGEEITLLGSSVSGISSSTTELASTAAQTATAINETTTTVEELRQTAQVANQKATHVADSAQEAARISRAGKKSTEETSEGIQRIRQQMESIAQSMVSLSEQTQAIGDIIATVDDLAQQSNLLAVNASIEAAKAGEQGKGFAVVAQEVKNLADQSRQATMQVRTILNDIQKATGAAVMATEQGSKAVEAGVTQAAQAGESIVTMAQSVDDSAQAAMQITASSQQQMVGMDQVAIAMEHIRRASSQNVDSARQLETAAQGLNDLGQRLKELMGQYKV